LRSPLQRLQNQQVQRPLQNLDSVLVPFSLFSHRLFPQSGLPPKVNSLTASSTWVDRICSLLLTTEPRPLFHPRLSTFYPQVVDTLHPALVQLLCRSGSTRKPLLARALSSAQSSPGLRNCSLPPFAFPISDTRPATAVPRSVLQVRYHEIGPHSQ